MKAPAPSASDPTAALAVRRLPAALFALLVQTVASAGCGADEAAPGEAAVVAGLTTDLAVGAEIHRLRVTARIDGRLGHEEDLGYAEGRLTLPAELHFEGLRDGAGVELFLDAFSKGADAPFLSRAAATRATVGRTLFMPVTLSHACADAERSCERPSTCIEGACRDAFLEPSSLGDFDPGWMDQAPDACKPFPEADPVVVVGQGERGYAELEDGDTVPIEAGPQGGHHVWLALRVKALRQAGSVLTARGWFPQLGTEVPPLKVGVTFHRVEDGFCGLFGLRFRVDHGADLELLYGKSLEIEVSVQDPTGDVGIGRRTVRLPDAAAAP